MMDRAWVGSPRLTLLACCLSFFMVILDGAVVNAALPAIGADLGCSPAASLWVVNASGLAFAALLLPAGALGDRLGARRVFAAGLGLFTAASAACGLAPTLEALLVARALQGAGAAALTPGSLALLAHAFPDPRGRARAFGLWGAVGGLAMAGGPVLGGVVADWLGWHSVFLIGVPLGVVALTVTFWHVAPVRPATGGADLLGQALTAAAVGGLSFALIETRARGWGSPVILAAMATALTAAGLLAVRIGAARRGADARSGRFAAANAVAFAHSFGLYGLLFALSWFFQSRCG